MPFFVINYELNLHVTEVQSPVSRPSVDRSGPYRRKRVASASSKQSVNLFLKGCLLKMLTKDIMQYSYYILGQFKIQPEWVMELEKNRVEAEKKLASAALIMAEASHMQAETARLQAETAHVQADSVSMLVKLVHKQCEEIHILLSSINQNQAGQSS